MNNLECPFRTADREIADLKKSNAYYFCRFSCRSNIGKGFSWVVSGWQVSAVIGTHTHVQTADERILPGGTAYITDAGMTGAFDSVIGIRKEEAIEKFLTLLPVKFEVAKGNLRLNGVVVEIDEVDRQGSRY